MVGWVGAALMVVTTASPAERAPFRILYNSDTTHILTCTSVWRPDRGPLEEEMFLRTVDEAADAGADAFMLAPGLGWVPWWPSKVLPLEEHMAWFREEFNLPKARTAFLEFVLNGGDFVQLTVDRCHERDMACFISFRMNDVHAKDTLENPKASHSASVPQFYWDHPEFLLGPQPSKEQTRWAQYLQDWKHPEVRDFKFRLIEELCQNYALDGLELDFMRAPYYFRQSETSSAERREIMLGFIKRIRTLLDETARDGEHRWLCVRIPTRMDAYDAMGIDVAAWAEAGVDMFNLSSFYHVEQTNDLAKIRELAPDSSIYMELTHVTAFNQNTEARSHRRTTPEIFETSAHLAYALGADGISLFNFQYYRDYRDAGQTTGDGPYSEPPFEVVRGLGDPDYLATRPQHYFQGSIMTSDPRRSVSFPVEIRSGKPLQLELDLAAPADGWDGPGRLRLQSRAPLDGQQFSVLLNGVPLSPAADVSEPYSTPYTQMHGAPEELRAWTVPSQIPRTGRNILEVSLTDGAPATLIALDLAFPSK